jgi:hypothetical protein
MFNGPAPSPTRRYELMFGDSVIMLRRLEGTAASQAVTHGLYAYVDSIEEHLARARSGDARILDPLKKHGDHFYIAEDLEGR